MREQWNRDCLEYNSLEDLTLKTKCDNDQLHKLLLKKIRLEITSGQTVLHVSSKQDQITEMLVGGNLLTKISSLDEIATKQIQTKKAFSYVIADMDSPALDDFEKFLDLAASMIIRPGLLIITASNLCAFKNKINFCFDNAPENFTRPIRAVPSGYLRNRLIEKGFFVKNRYWAYDDKLLIMADIPINN